MQLDNDLMTKNLERENDDFYNFQKHLRHYAKFVSDTVIIPILETHNAKMIMHQREIINQETQRLCFMQFKISKSNTR